MSQIGQSFMCETRNNNRHLTLCAAEGTPRALRRAARAQASLQATAVGAGAVAGTSGANGASGAAAAGGSGSTAAAGGASVPGGATATAPAGFITRSGRQVKRHWAPDMEVDEEELPRERRRVVMPPLPPLAAGREAGEDRKPRVASPGERPCKDPDESFLVWGLLLGVGSHMEASHLYFCLSLCYAVVGMRWGGVH